MYKNFDVTISHYKGNKVNVTDSNFFLSYHTVFAKRFKGVTAGLSQIRISINFLEQLISPYLRQKFCV